MFTQPKKNEEDILNYLAHAYRCYNQVEWDYARADAGIGRFLVDGCIGDSKKLTFIATIIGNGLFDGKENAKVASLLFDKLYRDGFKNGLFKDDIQDRFKEILPEESIKKLNEGEKMAACMQSICIYKEVMVFQKNKNLS